MGTETGEKGWIHHFETIDDNIELFRHEAMDYTRRLQAAIELTPELTVLDFGCGLGYAAEILAPKVGSLEVWDAAAKMRERSLDRLRSRTNVRLAQFDGSIDAQADACFDLILVNSVVQYMSGYELGLSFVCWHKLLKPHGRLVISDIPPPHSSVSTELVEVLRFAVKNQCLATVVRQAPKFLGDYLAARKNIPFLKLHSHHLGALAFLANLRLSILPSNLTYRSQRLTAVLTPK